MPTLDIEGRKVKVDDSFLSMSPDEQNAAVEEIAKSLGGDRAPTPQEISPVAPKGRPSGIGLSDIGRAADDTVRTLANGIPFMDRFAAGMGALTGIGGKKGDYEGNLAAERSRDKAIEDAHPILSKAGKFAGGTAATIAALPASAAVGGAGLLANMGRGGIAGAGLGGLYGASDTPDLTDVPRAAIDTAKGAGVGFGIGAALPVAGRVAGAAWRSAAPFFESRPDGMSRQARGILSNSIRPEASRRISELGPDAMLVDASPSTLGIGQGVATKPGPGRDALVQALERRNDGTDPRVRAAVTKAMGPAEDPRVIIERLKAARTAEADELFSKALGSAPKVNIRSVLDRIDKELLTAEGDPLTALGNMRKMLTRPNPAYAEEQAAAAAKAAPSVPAFVPKDAAQNLHNIKDELDKFITYGEKKFGVSVTGKPRDERAYKIVRGTLNDELERQIEGYSAANRAYADKSRQIELVNEGKHVLNSGKEALWPDTFERDFRALPNDQQRWALERGLRGDVEVMVGTKSNDLLALKNALQGEGGWNTAKMGTVYGREPIDEMVRAVDANQAFRDVYGKVAQGSQTAQRTAASHATDAEAHNFVISKDTTLLGLLGHALEGAGRKGLEFATQSTNDRVRNELARALMRKGPEARALLDQLNQAAVRRGATGDAIEGAISNPAIAAALLASGDRGRRSEAR